MPQKRKCVVFFLLLLGMMAGLVSGCHPGLHHADNETGRVAVVVTIFPLFDMVRHLGGEKVTVTGLLPPGASPHSFEPAAEQVKDAARAHLFVHMGGGLDDWAVNITRSGSDRMPLLNLYRRVLEQGWQPPGVSVSGSFGENGSGNRFNPHLWLDPITVRDYLCPAITEALMQVDRKNDTYYRSNLAIYQAELTALDDVIRSDLSGLDDKSFISVHAAWCYFAARYGLDEAAVISDFPGQEPPAKRLSELIDLCREQRVRVVTVEPQLSSGVAHMIAREIGGQTVLLDPLGGEGLARRDSYIDLMRYNTVVLKDALSKRK